MLKALKTICAVVDGETPVNLDPNEVIVVPPAEEGDLEKSLNSLEVGVVCTVHTVTVTVLNTHCSHNVYICVYNIMYLHFICVCTFI